MKQNTIQQGYKQTDIGVIPNDWKFTLLPEIIWYQEGPGLRNWQFKKSGMKVINVTNLQDNGYLDLSKTDRHISIAEFEKIYKHFQIDEGDVVIASSGNSYCKTAIVRQCDLPLLMNTSVVRFKAKNGIMKSYMLIFLKSLYFKNQIDLMITGGAQPNFGPFHLCKVYIPLPPTLAEQQAIAEALSDADALIESLEQLITKKRYVKQGAMQELLTGKRRLPGFEIKKGYKKTEVGVIPEDWEYSLLPELIWFQEGPGLRNWQFKTSGMKVINVTNLQDNGYLDLSKTDRHISIEESEKMYKHFLIDEGDVVIASSGNSYCKTAIVRQCDLPLLMNTSVIRFKAKQGIIKSYMLIFLKSLYFKNQIDLMITGGAQPNFGPFHLCKVNVSIPPTLTEQTAIATILSDMDAEIAELEIKLEKARQIKQGMMQELLTGRIRLV